VKFYCSGTVCFNKKLGRRNNFIAGHNEIHQIRTDVCESSCVTSQSLVMGAERRFAVSRPGTVVTKH